MVGMPMLASGLSTILTTTPLFATETRILKNFGAVIAVTMTVGILYVFLFLSPAMGLLGPSRAYAEPSAAGPLWKRIGAALYQSKAVRFIVVVAFMFLLLVRFPRSLSHAEGLFGPLPHSLSLSLSLSLSRCLSLWACLSVLALRAPPPSSQP